MAESKLTIEDGFLNYVKRYLRIFHDLDDEIIKDNIKVATEVVYETLCLIPQTDSSYPSTTSDFTDKKKMAIVRLVATYTQNPDDHLETKYIPYDKRVIERVLGSELGYPAV